MEKYPDSKKQLLHNQLVTLQKQQLEQILIKWMQESKKVKKQARWNDFIYAMLKVIHPNLDMNQVLIDKELLLEKLHEMIGSCNFRQFYLEYQIFIFIALSSNQVLQRIIFENKQIKQISKIQPFTTINRNQSSLIGKRQSMFIYNINKNSKTVFLTVQTKIIQKIKGQIIGQDQKNKKNFLSQYLFGNYQFNNTVQNLKLLQIRETDSFDKFVDLNSDNFYVIYQGRLTCFMENLFEPEQDNYIFNDSLIISRTVRAISSERQQKVINNINKIELNKGSIIEARGFIRIVQKHNKNLSFNIKQCKLLQRLFIFSIPIGQLMIILNSEVQILKNFLQHYEQVIDMRNTILQRSVISINFLRKGGLNPRQQEKLQCQVLRKTSYRGFRSSSASSPVQKLTDTQNVSTTSIFQTMIRGKQKVLNIKRSYSQRNSLTNTKRQMTQYLDYKAKRNYYYQKKVNNHRIQRLAARDSTCDKNQLQTLKQQFEEMRGIFEDESTNGNQFQGFRAAKPWNNLDIVINKTNKRNSNQVKSSFFSEEKPTKSCQKSKKKMSMDIRLQQSRLSENISQILQSKFINIDKSKTRNAHQRRSCNINSKQEILCNKQFQFNHQNNNSYQVLNSVTNLQRHSNKLTKKSRFLKIRQSVKF